MYGRSIFRQLNKRHRKCLSVGRHQRWNFVVLEKRNCYCCIRDGLVLDASLFIWVIVSNKIWMFPLPSYSFWSIQMLHRLVISFIVSYFLLSVFFLVVHSFAWKMKKQIAIVSLALLKAEVTCLRTRLGYCSSVCVFQVTVGWVLYEGQTKARHGF